MQGQMVRTLAVAGGLLAMGPDASRAWTADQISFPSEGNGWTLTNGATKYTGPDGSTEWFRYVLTAPASDASFEFKMAAGGWANNYGGNAVFPANDIGVMYYMPAGNSVLAGGTVAGNRYVFTARNPGLVDTYISVMELSGDPVMISGVSGGEGTYTTNQAVPITIYFATNPPPEEQAFVCYSTDDWASRSLVQAVVSGSVARVTLTNLLPATTYQWYALASTASGATLNGRNGFGVDALTLAWANHSGANYAFATLPGAAAWVYHNHDRAVVGDAVQFWAKIGYVNGDGSNPWVTHAAVYYTLDGSAPAGGYGAASNGSTRVLPMALNHIEEDPSPLGEAMKWQGILTNVPAFTMVRYKLGAWADAAHPEHFADYGSGTNDLTFAFQLGVLGDPVLTVASAGNGTLNANYTTSKCFVDEVAGDAFPLAVVFQPGESNVIAAELVSNLNRRDWADRDGNGDGVADGILTPDGNLLTTNDTDQYYAAMALTNQGAGRYGCTVVARKTGAYRLTARWKVEGDTAWRWYSNASAGRRDHAIVVSPVNARSIRLYELNALTVEAAGPSEAERSTFEDLWDGPGATHTNRWNLDYVTGLGCNWLWFQPIHPCGIDGRQADPGTGLAYDPGSPYAVKNFFEVSDHLSKGGTRAASLLAFSNFVAAADARDIGVMLDAPFNHTAWDCELAAAGAALFAPGAGDAEQIRDREARVYSRSGNYAMRASDSGNIAPAPDRGDFGKWSDVHDVYFGRYAALVDINPDDNGNYLNEGDWFDSSTGSEDAYGTGNGHFDAVTRDVWRYFAAYVPYWLDKTGYPANTNHVALDSQAGLDGLRCDFGQGLPPQCWEYIINVARARRWNFVFMSETLDGGATTYRSNRHFDILNENIVFPLRNATQASDYRALLEQRRTIYGQGLVLLNTTSHDEESYDDPWQAVVRMAVAGSVDGATMVFYGQELGISRTYGFDLYESNFGKQVPHFKRWNSMSPIWNNTNHGLDQLYPVIAGINSARQASPALRSSNRYFLNQLGGATHPLLWAVAKYEERGASPAFRDVVFAYANLDRDHGQSGWFDVNIAEGGTNLFGIRAGRLYNVRNLAAYAANDAAARTRWLWPGGGRSGNDVLASGLYASANPVPVSDGAWATAPYEAQYLKLYDVTPPPAPGTPTAGRHYTLTNGASFAWAPPLAGPDDCVVAYVVSIGTTPGGNDVVGPVNVGGTTNYAFAGTYGTTNYATVWAVSSAGVTSQVAGASGTVASPLRSDAPVVLLRPGDDTDGDGLCNADEALVGTDPLDAGSALRIGSVTAAPGAVGRAVTFGTQPGVTYRILFSDSALLGALWLPFGNTNNGIGSWFETNRMPSSFEFVDDQSPATTGGGPLHGLRFYRIEVP